MYSKIIVPLDGSRVAEQAIPTAAAIAQASKAEIEIVHVHAPFLFANFGDAGWDSFVWNEESRYVDRIVADMASEWGVRASGTVLRGVPAAVVCRRANEGGAGLVVMTSHGRTGVSRAWHGSVADGIIRHCNVPVLMVRATEAASEGILPRKRFSRVLVPLDGSPLAAEILGSAADLARAEASELILLQVVRPVPRLSGDTGIPLVYPTPAERDTAATEELRSEATRYLAGVARALGDAGVVRVDEHVMIADSPAQAILDFARAREVDAIAMSTQGRGASRLFVGSVADKVLRGSEVPMLVRRPMPAPAGLTGFDEEAVEGQLHGLVGFRT